MFTNLLPRPKIEVLRWNAWKAYVECPYCVEIHHQHGVAFPGRRASNCNSGSQYEFTLPIDESSELVGYKIDKRRACFLNVSLQMGERDIFQKEMMSANWPIYFPPQ